MLTIIVTTGLAVILSISIHYAMLLLIAWALANFYSTHPISVVLALFLAMVAHLMEIMAFALALDHLYAKEIIQFSVHNPDFIDILYFSGTSYTTLGYGDIVIVGHGRICAVIESVMGLVLIAWTASFTFFEINSKHINRRKRIGRH